MQTCVVETRLPDDARSSTGVVGQGPVDARAKLRASRRAALLAACVVLIVAFVAVISIEPTIDGAAPPGASDVADAVEDLSTLLVDLPATKWVAAPNAPSQGVGPFGIDEAAQILSKPLVPEDAVETRLEDQGFTRGFGRVWARRGTGQIVASQVLEFTTEDNARTFDQWARFGDEASGFAVYDVPLPDGYGFVITPELLGFHGRGALYRDGRRVFIVIRGAQHTPTQDDVLRIARAQLNA